MTTIATDGKSMACDGQVMTGADTIVSTAETKLVRLRDGRILGTSGRRSERMLIAAWLNAKLLDDQAEKPKTECDVLILGPAGVTYMDCHLVEMPSEVPAAIGSGSDHALTAMDMGAPPERAVALAAKRDPFTGGSIAVMYPDQTEDGGR